MAACATIKRRPGQDLGQRPRIDRQRVDEGHLLLAIGNALPGHLDQRQARPVGPLSVELGVKCVGGRPFEAVNERCQARFGGYDLRVAHRCERTSGWSICRAARSHPRAKGRHLSSLRLRPRPELGEATSQHARHLHLSGADEGADLGLGPTGHEAQVDHQALSL